MLGVFGPRTFATQAVPAKTVKELRDRTGASMGKCREALKQEDGDVEKAVEWLRRRGVKSMEKRAADAFESLLAVSSSPSAAVIVELRAETDYVTRGKIFQQFSLALAATAARCLPGGEALQDATLQLPESGFENLSAGASVSTALLEVGSVLGERLVLGSSACLAAPRGGVVASYVHPRQADGLSGTGRLAALVSMRPDGDSSDAERLQAAATQVARHTVAMQPRFVSVESIPADVLSKEMDTLRAAHLEQMGEEKAAKVSEDVMAKVLQGKAKKFYSETVLLNQEILLPQAGDAKPVSVEKWLQAEAKAMGLRALVLEDFKLLCL